ncbi:MAG: DUF1810 domain-containing protein [Bacilli bacterium]|nr:DUF1810 domain-containing protein [Bacilli bacterium]
MNSLDRFIDAQEYEYEMALKEIKRGRKYNHWMWFIFPQIKGLGQSETAIYFAIKNIEESQAYLNHDILGQRLIEITNELLKLNISDPIQIFGDIDSMKLKSCMTLFDYISLNNDVFYKVLEKFYDGYIDINTLDIIDELNRYTKY